MSLPFSTFYQQQAEQQEAKNSLPSPPDSSCGDVVEKESKYSFPENYTIEHSSSPSPNTKRRYSATSTSSTSSTEATTAQQKKRRRRILSPSTTAYHKCIECGKVYKHPNCLTKHRWEHSEGWRISSQFLLTKHQKVQLLEAAAILINMRGKKHPLLDDSSSMVAVGRQGKVAKENSDKEKEMEDDKDEEEEEKGEIQIDLDDDL